MMQMMKKAFFGALFSCKYLHISKKSCNFAGNFACSNSGSGHMKPEEKARVIIDRLFEMYQALTK